VSQLTPHQGSGLVQPFQHVPRVLLSPCGVQNRPHGRDRAAVFPDHLPDVFLRDPQFNDERVLTLNPVHAHVVWVVHNRFRYVFDQFDDGRGVTSRGYTGFTASAVRSRRPRDDTIVRRFGRAARATWHILRWHMDVY
jgi:hypothetical protein